MGKNDSNRIETGAGISNLSRRKFLATAAICAGGVSTLGFPVLARAASAAAEKTGGTGVVAEIAREEALTFGKNRYMGAPVTMAKAPNGAVTNGELLSRIGDFYWLKPTIENPVKGIYVLGGYSVAPMAFIETEDGLIAFDTGDTKHDGQLNLQAIRTVTKKPFKAIIYGHSHTCFGAAVLAEGNKDVMVIGHPGLNDVVKANLGGAPAFYPEVGPYLTARALVQFNAYMPKEGPDAYVVPTNLGKMDPSAFIPVNRPVQDGEEMTIVGVKMQFFTKYGSDDKVHTTVWLPERKILFTTLLWCAPPQLYTLRGDVFRDPRVWIEGLKFNRDLNAEVLISAACKPVVGAQKIRQTIEQYLDGASFVLDQSLRGILGGLGPDDLRHFVKFPKYLYDAPINLQSYGEISSYSPAIFYQTVGWYDNDAANLKPLAPVDEARRLVPLMGGREKVLAAAKAALDKKEFAWAAKLVNQLYLIDNQDKQARQLKAECLRQMAYVSTGANDRAHLMSQALALEGKVKIARLIPPPPEAIVATPATFVDYFRVRIDPEKSGTTDKLIRFEFADSTKAGLHVRRAVAEFVPDPDKYQHKTDVTVSMSGETWGKLYLSLATPEDLIKKGEIKVKGDATEAARLLNLFDRYKPEKAVVIPPAFYGRAR
jgi:alkyl sulfatase BDS1-like metallo-beta-lactamase superfamily hydrolase